MPPLPRSLPPMRPEYALPADFTAWEAKAKIMTIAELLWTVKDCQEAAACMKGFNPDKEGFYIDQACTFGMELTRRKAS